MFSLKQSRQRVQEEKANKIRAPQKLHAPLQIADLETSRQVVLSVFFIDITIKKCAFKFDSSIVLCDAVFRAKKWQEPRVAMVYWNHEKNSMYMGKTMLRRWNSDGEYYSLGNGGVKIWGFVEGNEPKMLQASHLWFKQLTRKHAL